MPYITSEKRIVLEESIAAVINTLRELESDDPLNNFEGNLNYLITTILMRSYADSYRDVNDAIGVLECIKLEYYRKRAAPYEDLKELLNGKVL